MKFLTDMHSLEIFLQVKDVVSAVLPQYPELGHDLPRRLLIGSRKMDYTMSVAPFLADNIEPPSEAPNGYLLRLGHNGMHYHWELLGPSAKHGLIAHELAHMVQFNRMSTIGVGIALLRYLLSRRYRRAFEREADAIAIERGYGRQLEQYATFALSQGSKRHRRRKAELYMSPREINVDTRLWELKKNK